MFGPKVHLFAAAIAFTVGGASGASAGLFDNNCCAPVVWGCQSTCAHMPNIIYGTVPQAYYPRPVYRVNQGPVYEPSDLSYSEPAYEPEAAPAAYPYVGPYSYGYPYYGPRYHRFGPRVHYGIHRYRHFGITTHRPFVQRFRSGPHYRTAMHANHFVNHRPTVHAPFAHRAPMMHRRR